MEIANASFVTSGGIAEALGRDVSHVRHILASRNDIRPVGRAGLVRIYAPDVIARVRAELDAIEVKRAKSRCA